MAIKKRSVLERLRYWCRVTLQKIFWLHCVISTARLTSEVKGNALDYYRVPTKEVVTAVEKASNGWRMDVSPLKYVWHHCDISLSCSKFKSRVEMHHLSAVKYGMQSFLPAVAKGQLISKCPFWCLQIFQKKLQFFFQDFCPRVQIKRNKDTLNVPLIRGFYFDSYIF